MLEYPISMDYADAVLVHLATVGRITRIWSYDRRDFSVYRPLGLGKFKIVP